MMLRFTGGVFFHILRFMARKIDDFDEGDSDGLFDQVLNIVSNRKREFAIVSVVAAVVLLGVVVFGSYPDSEETAANESVPIVRADAGDYKTTPDNPGGMEIPYRDSTVFSSNGDNATENILAEDTKEEPLPRDELFAGLNTEQQAEQPAATTTTADSTTAPTGKGELEETMAKVESVEQPSNDDLVKEAIGTTPKADETKTAAAIIPEAAKAAPVTKEAEAPTKAEPIVKAEAPKTAPAKIEPAAGNAAAKGITYGTSYVQLASVKSTAGADAEWKKMQAKFPALRALQYRTQEANLGAKGTFYRIQAGPMSKEDATRICSEVKSGGGTCIVAAK